MVALPDTIVAQFRSVAQERLARIEAAWAELRDALDGGAAGVLDRELHTLKGEARVVGFADVHAVCHKLEDLIAIARDRGYAVDDTFDATVDMAIQLLALLVRKRVGAQVGGIDLPGFLEQIDRLIASAHSDKPRPRTGSNTPLNRTSGAPRVPGFVRERLAPVAVDAFVEYATATGARRDRLRTSWHALRDMVGLQRAMLGPAQLAAVKANVLALATELAKDVEVTFALASAEVTAEVLAAVDVATLHLARNAVDHGIEPPHARAAAGKLPTGRVALRGGIRAERFVLELEDDGAGISFSGVRARALELGITAATLDALDEARLIELMCQPGFSTRTEPTSISGRGVGLAAVRSAVTELGGTLTASTKAGAGTTWIISLPVPRLAVHGHVLRAPGLPFPVMLESAWQPCDRVDAPALDVAARLGLVSGPGASLCFAKGDARIAVHAHGPAEAMLGRRVIAAPGFAEVVQLDASEGLLIRP